MDTKTFVIENCKRKSGYFKCQFTDIYGKNKSAKLLINEISKNIKIKTIVEIQIKDASEELLIGYIDLIFEPVKFLSVKSLYQYQEETQKRRKFVSFLKFAQDDVHSGLDHTNAINKTLDDSNDYPEFVKEIMEIKEKIKLNKIATEEKNRLKEIENSACRKENEFRKQMRNLYLVDFTPPLNIPVLEENGKYVVYTNFGKIFTVNADTSSIYGDEFLGHEGDDCCYCYYRYATEDEIANFK